jgi:hypothetical protein
MFLLSNKCQKLNLLFAYNFLVNYWRIYIKNGIIFSVQCKTIELVDKRVGIEKNYVISSIFKANSLISNNIN